MPRIVYLLRFFFVLLFVSAALSSYSQDDTTEDKGIDSFLLKQRGLAGKLARSIYRDTVVNDASPVRNDLLFRRYEGRTIRLIEVYAVDFGTLISDTSQRFQSKLIRLANKVHRKTRGYTIKDNLFFKEGDKVSSALLADNERHLRDQPYLHDARIIIRPVAGRRDLVDVIVFTKDVLSIGGTVRIHNTKTITVLAKEDNVGGWGDRIQVGTLYEVDRHRPFGYSAEVIKRNIAGTFINATAGFTNYNKARNSALREETMVYSSFARPLVNPYMRFTYAVEGGYHYTNNMYVSDSLYNQDVKYRYFNYDAWIAYNIGAFRFRGIRRDDRLRTLISLRYLKQQFDLVPDKNLNFYNYQYMNVRGLLASVSVFKQNTYKTQYVYGFGRHEDVPEGLDVSFTAGKTVTEKRDRLYMGLDFQGYYFTFRESYFNYTFRAGGYMFKNNMEDINILANLDYFNRLLTLGKWKQRSFISVGFARQFKRQLNEPLFLESQFGLPEWRNNRQVVGALRATLKGEAVFYSPLDIVGFRFAPFVFGNICYLSPAKDELLDRRFYNTIGGGIRTRNESLIFGTIELKGYYYPRGNYFGHNWIVEMSTNIRFTYNSPIVRRPSFVQAN